MKNLSKILVVVILLTTLLTCIAGLNLNASAATTRTIYLKLSGSYWGSADAKYYAWTWGGSSADAWVQFTDDNADGILEAQIPSDRTGMKIRRFSPTDTSAPHWNSAWNETGDLTITSNKNCYSNSSWSGGSWTNITVEAPTYTVAGDTGLVGANWATSNANAQMSDPDGDGVYTLVLKNVAAGTYKYKVAINGTWDVSYGVNGSDASVTVGADNCTVTIKFTPKTKTVTATPTSTHSDSATDNDHNCDNCGKADVTDCSYDQSTVKEEALKTAATCKSEAVYYMSCLCGNIGDSATFISGSKNPDNHTGIVVNGGTQGVHTKYDCCGATASAEHSYTSSVTAPTCDKDGYTTYTCDCGYSYTGNVVTAEGHSYTVTLNTTAPTCTTEGSKTLKCEHCDSEKDEVISVDADAHKWVAGETVLPTCSAQGYTNYTCEHDAAHTKRDNYTEINSEAHAWNEGVVTTPADCENTGVKTYTCSHNAAHTREEEIPALNHIYDNEHDLDCNREGCNHTRACTHEGTEREVIPGYAATCTANGLTNGERCKNCGETTVAQQVIVSEGHKYSSSVTNPTCTAGGYTTYTCSECNDTYTGNVTAALGHTEEVVAGKDATCTATGLTAGKKCTVCGTVTVEQTTIPAKGHTPVVDKAVDATCTTDGKTEGSHCGVCGETLVPQQTIPAGHSLVEVSKKDATCTEAGYTAHKDCSRCDYTEGYTALPAGHNYVNGECTACDFVQMYFINSNGWSEVAAYYWTGNTPYKAWPGVKINATGEKVHGFDIYVVEVDSSKYNQLIFNNNKASGAEQTGNLALNPGHYFYYKSGSWYSTLEEVPEKVLNTDFFMVGSFNGWNQSANCFMLETEGGTISYVTLELEANKSYEFKVKQGEAWYSYSSAITAGVTDAKLNSTIQSNIAFTTKCAGEYTFVLEVKNSVVYLDVVYPEHSYATKGETVAPTFDAKGYTLYSCSCGETEKRDYVDALVAVAQIGEQRYETLQDAVAAAQNGDVIVLVSDVVLENSLVILANKTVVLDLAGYTVSQSKECTDHYAMIDNKGNLTITGNGKISFKDTSAGDPGFNWGSYTIANYGTLVVENGTVEHLGAQTFATHMICAIWQYSGSTTINDGVFSTPNYRSVRLWKGDMTINGGTFDGQLWVQSFSNETKLTINGGTFGPNGGDGSSVFVTNNEFPVALAITGGNFTTKIGASIPADIAGAITGGTFATDVSAFVAEGYHLMNGAVSKHSYDEGVITTPAGCETEGVMTYTCACGHTYTDKVVPTGHSWNDGEVTVVPGCTTTGVKTYTCQNDASHTKTEEVQSKGHSYEKDVTAPTCTTEGYTTYTCACGDTYTGNATEPTGHKDTNNDHYCDNGDCDEKVSEHTGGEATCQSGAICTICGNAYGEVDSDNHNYGEGVVTDPTCKDKGYTTYTCACGNYYVSDEIPATGAHTGGTATCQKLAECEVCGTPYGELGTHTYDAEGFDKDCNTPGCDHVRTCAHNGDKEIIPGTPATCTTPGYTNGEKCAICGEVTVARQETGLADHVWGAWTVTIAPTCTTAGEERHDCDNCDAYETRRVEKLGHDYDAVVTAPTCTEQGFTTHTCKNEGCGNSYVDSFVDKLPHEYSSEITKEPTCTEKGVKTFTCECGKSYTEEIAATGHSYGEGVVTAPTCTTEGYTTYTCACGDSYTDSYTDKVAHADNDNDHMCDGCGEVKLSEHAYMDGVCVICGEQKPADDDQQGGEDQTPDDGEDNQGGENEGEEDVTPPAEEPGYVERITAKIVAFLTEIGVPENITYAIAGAIAKVLGFFAALVGKLKF